MPNRHLLTLSLLNNQYASSTQFFLVGLDLGVENARCYDDDRLLVVI
jgi:hypothetical protein